MLYRLHHHDGVIHHDTDGQYETEHRQRIDGKIQRDEEDESTDNGHGNSQYRDQRRPPVLQEEEHDDRYQQQGDQQGSDHIVYGYLHDRH